MFKIGDKVKAKVGRECSNCKGKIMTIYEMNDNGSYPFVCKFDDNSKEIFLEDAIELVSKKHEVNNMEDKVPSTMECIKIDDMKKANVEEAKKQCVEEAKNYEIEEAKRQYNRAVDERDRLDRKIKSLQEDKAKQQEILDKFKSSK